MKKQKLLNFILLLIAAIFLCSTNSYAAKIARTHLNADEKILYDALSEQIEDVAKGKKRATSYTFTMIGFAGLAGNDSYSDGSISIENANETNEIITIPECMISFDAMDLGVDSIINSASLSGKGYVTLAAKTALKKRLEKMADRIFLALVSDYPMELYWMDRANGIDMCYQYQPAVINGKNVLLITDISYYLTANSDYASSDPYTVDQQKTSAAGRTIEKALSIVAGANGKSDLEKLDYYREEILSLATYDEEPQESGNPYELIWLFDGDVNTKVVCEAYAKAFQYLCDLSNFSSNIKCLTVRGELSIEDEVVEANSTVSHAWNLISYNGKNYIVDLTNCDEDSIAEPDLLFMCGQNSGTVETGYKVIVISCEDDEKDASSVLEQYNLTYKYDANYTSFFTKSELTLAEHQHDAFEVIENSVSATVDIPESYEKVRYCKSCLEEVSREKVVLNRLKATGKWCAKSLPMKIATKVQSQMISGLAKGDYVASYKSSNTSILKVKGTKKGLVTFFAGNKTGTVYVTAKLHSGKKLKVKVVVTKKKVKTKKLHISIPANTIKQGKQFKIITGRTPVTSLQPLTYEVSNKSILNVSRDGKVTAKACGSAVVTVKSGLVKKRITITVV